MIKVKLHIAKLSRESKLSIYDSINRIPFSLRLVSDECLQGTIKSRNISDKVFIEFRFFNHNRQLYEVTLVSAQKEIVTETSIVPISDSSEFYDCFIDESSELRFSTPMTIDRTANAVRINFSESKIGDRSFMLNEVCEITVDEENLMQSFTLTNQSEPIIHDILGF